MTVARAGSVYIMETIFSIKVHVFLCWKDLRWVEKQTVYRQQIGCLGCPGVSGREDDCTFNYMLSSDEKLGD